MSNQRSDTDRQLVGLFPAKSHGSQGLIVEDINVTKNER